VQHAVQKILVPNVPQCLENITSWMVNATPNVHRSTIHQVSENVNHVSAIAINVKMVHHATTVRSHQDWYRLQTLVNHNVLQTSIIEKTQIYV